MSVGKYSSTSDKGFGIAAAVCVLVVGFLAAMMFRLHRAPSGSNGIDGGDRLVLRGQADQETGNGSSAQTGGFASGGNASGFQSASFESPKVLRPMPAGSPSPELAKEFPMVVLSSNAVWDQKWLDNSAGFSLAAGQPRKHKVVDGDTLSSLAERYLGSADRWREIQDANPGLILTPEILPIGAELQIPAIANRSQSAPNYMPKRPLASVSE
jgi:phage tail protein X